VGFEAQINGIGENSADPVKKFHNVDLGRISGVGWANLREIGRGENYGFDIGASKLFNNSTTSPTKIGKCPYFMSNVEASSLSFQEISCFRTNVPLF